MSNLVSKFVSLTFLLLFLEFLAFDISPVVSAHQSDGENSVIIHVTEKGYEPNFVTITKGTTVIFENVGESVHWPASDHHPSHTQYSGTTLEEHCKPTAEASFDACKPIKTGESYSFLFDKEGTFTFHDHLWPHLAGEVKVKANSDTEPSEAAQGSQTQVKIFQRISNFFKTQLAAFRTHINRQKQPMVLNSGGARTALHEESSARYEKIVQEKDPREAIRVLQEDSTQNEKVSAICHDMLHVIGHKAYEKNGGFKEAIQYNSDFCNSGYIHGLFESYFKSEPDSLNGLVSVCAEYASATSFDRWQCHHGIGHGFMYLTGGDLDTSLTLCKEHLDSDNIEDCQNGVYMELFNSEILAKEKDSIDPNNPFATCTNRIDAKDSCYLYVPTYLSQIQSMAFEDMFEECQKVELKYRAACNTGIGSEALKRNMNTVETVFDLCERARGRLNSEACVRGVAGMYINQKGTYKAGHEICDKAPREYESICRSQIESMKELFE